MSVLIIEDDPGFAKILLNIAHEKGFKGLIAGEGKTGISLADYYRPGAIILDIRLPDIDGWTVMDRLKDNPRTRHIPVHIISGVDKPEEGMKMGAIGHLTKPVDPDKLDEAFQKIENRISGSVKKLLVVEDNEIERKYIIKLVSSGSVQTTGVGTCKQAYKTLKSDTFDCMILDLGMPDMSGAQFLKELKKDESIVPPPVIVYTGSDLSRAEEDDLQKYAESIIIKGEKSPDRLLDETTLFLHLVESDLPESRKKTRRMTHNKEEIFEDKKILLVDDDMRNIFALSSTLEEKGMHVMAGKNGKEGLECLRSNPEIDLVLMDIMMPEMDGYEAMREIRKEERFRTLPVIALTAKAMKGDREKCIDAGASDYISKPVDTDRLLSIMRVWLYQ